MTKWLAANTQNGIYEIDPVDFPEVEYLSFSDFVDSLKYLQDGEEVYMIANPDELEILEEEYGVFYAG